MYSKSKTDRRDFNDGTGPGSGSGSDLEQEDRADCMISEHKSAKTMYNLVLIFVLRNMNNTL